MQEYLDSIILPTGNIQKSRVSPNCAWSLTSAVLRSQCLDCRADSGLRQVQYLGAGNYPQHSDEVWQGNGMPPQRAASNVSSTSNGVVRSAGPHRSGLESHPWPPQAYWLLLGCRFFRFGPRPSLSALVRKTSYKGKRGRNGQVQVGVWPRVRADLQTSLDEVSARLCG